MRKMKMYISFLLFLLFTSSQVKAEEASKAQDIPVYKKGAHLGARTTEPSVTASLDNNSLAVNVSKYVGEANVVIMDMTGSIVANATFIVGGNGSLCLGISELKDGAYSVTIELGNVIYCGTIDIGI